MFNLLKNFHKEGKSNHGPIEYVIAGLGNPGAKYEKTRHNAGFMAIDYIANELGVKVNKSKFQGEICDVDINGKRAILLKPQTFMNLSGNSVAEVLTFYKIPVEKLIVIYDDISLDPGKIRIRRKGSAGGHNGIKNIIENIGSDKFPRIKIGIGNKPEKWDLANYVTGEFSKEQLEALSPALNKSYEALKLMIIDKTDEAMNKFN